MPALPEFDNPLQQPLRGAYCALPELTGARFAAAELALGQRRRAQAQLAGGHRSAQRGRGLEFEEVRAYQPGDDVRTIDWRVTARSDRPFTKLFREERERPLLIAVDQRQPMFFGSRTCFKSKLAAYLGALLAWAGLQRGDRVGGLVFGNTERRDLRPRHTRRAALAWLNALHDFNHRLQRDTALAESPEQSLAAALTDLRRGARPGSSIFLISDGSGAGHPAVREQLHRLARHNQLTALFINDPLERELPPPGRYTVTDGSRRLDLDSGDNALRARHRDCFDQRVRELQSLFAGLGAPLIPIATDQPPLAVLGRYFGGQR